MSGRLIGENIRVIEDLCTGGDTVLADAAQIHQALMNLVINARDAMPDGGHLLGIATTAVEVGDGLATPTGYRSRRVRSARRQRHGDRDGRYRSRTSVRAFFYDESAWARARGLGLATVYGTVRQSRGGIAVESEPGTGSHVSNLPATIHFRTGARWSPARWPPATLVRGASTILVVEDEEAVRRLVVDLLRGAGYRVLEAAEAQEAMAIATEHREAIHLLLTDMVMPGLSGRKLADSLRDLHPESKVLLVSGYSESLVSADALDKSIRYLQKPFTPEHLTRVVKEALVGRDGDQVNERAIQRGNFHDADAVIEKSLDCVRSRSLRRCRPRNGGAAYWGESLVEFAPLRGLNLDFSWNKSIGR